MATSLAFIDDHPVLLEGLASIFDPLVDFEVVGKGRSAEDAIEVTMRSHIDVLVMDLNMPGDAFGAIAKIGQQRPHTKIIAFTASVGVDYAVRALEAGAHGYVIKGSPCDELIRAISAVVAGETYITQSFAGKVVSEMRLAALRKTAAQAIRLSVREEQILRLLLRGYTNREIANVLKISEKTVKHYMTILMQKLNARNRIEVVLAAQRMESTRPAKMTH